MEGFGRRKRKGSYIIILKSQKQKKLNFEKKIERVKLTNNLLIR